MAAAAWVVYGAAKEGMADGSIDLDTDTFRMVLVTSSYTPAATTDDTWSDVSTNEASGTGYTANGKLLTCTWVRSGGTVTFDCDDQTWTSTTISDFKYALIVKDADSNGALAAGDLLVCYSDLNDGGGALSTTAADISVTINASGVFTLA